VCRKCCNKSRGEARARAGSRMLNDIKIEDRLRTEAGELDGLMDGAFRAAAPAEDSASPLFHFLFCSFFEDVAADLHSTLSLGL